MFFKKKVDRTCPICHSSFKTYLSEAERGGGIYCSRKCYYLSRKNSVECTCGHCQKVFEVTVSAFNDGRGKYCSQECCDRARAFDRVCDHCGKTFKIWRNQAEKRLGKYCSKKCAQKALNPRIVKTCQQCGEQFGVTPSRDAKNWGKFCSYECNGKWKSENLTGENSATWQGGTIYYYGPNWNTQREKARNRDKYTCQRCGITEVEQGMEMDVHHKKPFRSFGYKPGENETYKQANDLGNLISLCRVCHAIVEHSS